MLMIHCADCNVPFAIFEAHDKRLRSNHASFYCPNGHSNVYRGESEADKLRKQLAETQVRANRATEEAARLRRERRVSKSPLNKCPHCAKRVVNLTAHVKRMHKR